MIGVILKIGNRDTHSTSTEEKLSRDPARRQPCASGETKLANTILNAEPPELCRNEFLLFKPTSGVSL